MGFCLEFVFGCLVIWWVCYNWLFTRLILVWGCLFMVIVIGGVGFEVWCFVAVACRFKRVMVCVTWLVGLLFLI